MAHFEETQRMTIPSGGNHVREALFIINKQSNERILVVGSNISIRNITDPDKHFAIYQYNINDIGNQIQFGITAQKIGEGKSSKDEVNCTFKLDYELTS